jgi:formylglycine-generating enzyme required for sulfatase activity
MNLLCRSLLALWCAASGLFSSADVIIPTVIVGDPGNPPVDTGWRAGLGTVDYEFHISKFEVTVGQYAAFLNAVARTSDPYGLFTESMPEAGISRTVGSANVKWAVAQGYENKPIRYLDFWSAARFANWMTNGQPTADAGPGVTEDGMYDLLEGGLEVQRDLEAWQNGGVAVVSRDEWVKAALYDPTKHWRGGYWEWPTRSDDTPRKMVPNNTNPNSANYNNVVGTVTEVGAYSTANTYYGTFDQFGNVDEWTDTIGENANRWTDGSNFAQLGSGFRSPSSWTYTRGFRVVSLKSMGNATIQSEPLWKNAATHVNGWRSLDWLGYFYVLDRLYMYHAEHGSLLIAGDDPEGFYIYDVGMELWSWTSRQLYPYLYVYNESPGWYYYFRGGSVDKRWYFSVPEQAYLTNSEVMNRRPVPTGFAHIKAGSFMMGSPEDEPMRRERDEPLHEVTLTRDFLMQKTEVTVSQMVEVLNWAVKNGLIETAGFNHFTNLEGDPKRLVRVNGHYRGILWDEESLSIEWGRWFHPCWDVTWYGAAAYCNYLSDMEGLERAFDFSDWSVDIAASGYRLPTEAEWEYACRAGTSSPYYTGFDEADLARAGWYSGNSNDFSHRVGLKVPNAWDLYDMHGNLREYCLDFFGDMPEGPAIDPQGPSSGLNGIRTARGGNWYWMADDARSASRSAVDSEAFSNMTGFRVVRTLDQN